MLAQKGKCGFEVRGQQPECQLDAGENARDVVGCLPQFALAHKDAGHQILL